MKLKKWLAGLTAAVLTVLTATGFASCGKKATYTVGVCQLAQHDALDSATQGFCDALKAAFGDEVDILVKNASGDAQTCSSIVGTFVSQKVDLILANATAALQAARSATSEIPILGTSVTDYASALEIADWTGVVGGNVSGTSDLAPLSEQADMILELVPNAKKVAILYCSAEPNSKYQADVIATCLKALNVETKEFSFVDSNDVQSVTRSACAYADAIYIPTDNTAASNTESIANVVLAEKVPVIAGEKDTCSGCGVASLSIDYYQLGYETGKMAVEILRGEKQISEMPIQYAPEAKKLYQAENCKKLGITVPNGYTAITAD